MEPKLPVNELLVLSLSPQPCSMHLPPNIKQRIVNLLLFIPPQHQRRSAKKVVFEALELIDDTAALWKAFNDV